MNKLIFIAIFISFCFTPVKKNKVIFFGDSITEQGLKPGGYIKRIDSMCTAEQRDMDFEFTGAGVSGNKVYDLYLRMKEDVLNKNPDLVVIYIGINDVWHKATSGTGTDPDKFEKFYQAIMNEISSIHAKIILCTPSVIGERTDFTNQQDGDLNKYAGMIRNLASKNKLPLVDLRKDFLTYNMEHNPGNLEKGILTTDRVHLNAAGNQLVAGEIWGMIKQQF
jgi:lysophospholipase L1-like esterase